MPQPTTDRRCGTCDHFSKLPDKKGNCRRWPPVAVSSVWSLPVVEESGVCGEWKKAEK